MFCVHSCQTQGSSVVQRWSAVPLSCQRSCSFWEENSLDIFKWQQKEFQDLRPNLWAGRFHCELLCTWKTPGSVLLCARSSSHTLGSGRPRLSAVEPAPEIVVSVFGLRDCQVPGFSVSFLFVSGRAFYHWAVQYCTCLDKNWVAIRQKTEKHLSPFG